MGASSGGPGRGAGPSPLGRPARSPQLALPNQATAPTAAAAVRRAPGLQLGHVPRGPWRNIDAVEFAALTWVDWFNNRRLFAPIGYIPPTEFEEAYYRGQTNPAMVAELT